VRPLPVARPEWGSRRPREKARTAQARVARAGRDVAVRREPRASSPGSQGSAGPGPGQGFRPCRASALLVMVPGPARGTGPALRAGERDRPAGDGRALDRGDPGSYFDLEPRKGRRDPRPG